MAGYTHILLGCGEDCRYKFDSLLARVTQAGSADWPDSVSEAHDAKQIPVNENLLRIAEQVHASRQAHAYVRAISVNSFGQGLREEESDLLRDLRQRNAHI